jgi:hypothetical protein
MRDPAGSAGQGPEEHERDAAAGPARQCAWCGRVQGPDGRYAGPALPLLPEPATHGICPDCQAPVLREMWLDGVRAAEAGRRALADHVARARGEPPVRRCKHCARPLAGARTFCDAACVRAFGDRLRRERAFVDEAWARYVAPAR